jgi:hypothetical protein
MNSRQRLFLVFFLIAAGTAAFCQASKPPVIVIPGGGTTLPKARLALAKAVGNEFFRTYLETYALALPVHDAIALCKEYVPKAQASQRSVLYSFAGSLALIAGRPGEAADFFSQAPPDNVDTQLRAVRCYIAAGNTRAAAKLLETIPDAGSGNSFVARKNLALSWIFMIEGDPEKAFALLQSINATKGEDQVGREALFLQWLIASSSDFSSFSVGLKGSDAKSIETLLASEFPKSMELALIRKLAFPQPASWLLSGLYAPAGKSDTDHSMAQTPAKQSQGAEKSLSQARLQVGWFSKKENAEVFAAKLRKQGFSVKIEEQDVSGGEKHWAVILDVAGDWSKTQARLKDMGYESYLLP